MDCSRARTRDPIEWLAMAPERSAVMAHQLREWILDWAPDLEESIKWNMLCYSGRKLVCGISACQRHLGLTFFRGGELPDPGRMLEGGPEAGIRSIRWTSFENCEQRALRRLIEAAVALDEDVSAPPPPKKKREPYPVPEFFAAALRQNSKAAAGFSKLSASCQREYLVWLASAKRPETRERRLQETLKALASGRRWSDRHATSPSRP